MRQARKGFLFLSRGRWRVLAVVYIMDWDVEATGPAEYVGGRLRCVGGREMMDPLELRICGDCFESALDRASGYLFLIFPPLSFSGEGARIVADFLILKIPKC